MSQETAEARGRVMMRPWRVGLLVDVMSIDEVRTAIARLSSVWGGIYMPILDVNASAGELDRLARQYDVDALVADVVDGPVDELLRTSGLNWPFRGPWGPFSEEGPLRKGLLPVRALLSPSTYLVQPTWGQEHDADLALAAIWGLPDELGLPLADGPAASGARTVPVTDLLTARTGDSIIGILAATKAHTKVQPRVYLDGYAGIWVIPPNNPRAVVEFWNMRLYGTRVVGVPASHADQSIDFLLSGPLPGYDDHRGNTELEERCLRVWGLDDASSSVAHAIGEAAQREGLAIRSQERADVPRYAFQGLRTRFTQSIRVDFRPDARWVDIPLPNLAIEVEPDSFARGVIAADVEWHSVVGQDPRMTVRPPPFPQIASLLKRTASTDNVDHARATSVGVALGVDAGRDLLRVPFAFSQEAIRLLFNDDKLTASQSDVGRFQTRAAQKFGGPFAGVFTQPGVREAITIAAGKRNGVALPHLRHAVSHGAGEWPDPLFGPTLTAKEYGSQLVNDLLHSGVFVPTLRVHCSFCRVEVYVEADALSATMTCEFCGQPFSLALSHSLAKPDWRYRLAAHLGPDQITALLPALAAASFLSQLRHLEEPPLTHVLGLELSDGDRTIEVDLAAFVPDYDWALVLAEVKTGNRLLPNDLDNLEFLRGKLASAGVRCLLMFATLKKLLTSDEKFALRAMVERAPMVCLSRGQTVPNLPLVLTGPDLSHPPGNENHPWRWDNPSHSGLFGTALTSCRRNLGLHSYSVEQNADSDRILYRWED